MANYYVPDSLAGQTLGDLSGKYGFRGDVLGNFGGVDQNTPLKAGQAFNLPAEYGANSSEGGFASRNFTSEQDYQTKKAADVQSAATAAQQAAVAPAIATMQGQVDPLKSRYDKLIADIKGRRDTAVQQVGIDTAREYGKRGIPTSSGVFDVALRNATTPVEQSYGQNITGAEGEGQDKIMAIQNAIAGLQAGAGKDAITQALEVLKNSQAQGNWEKTFSQNQQELDLKKTASQNDPYGLFS